MSRILLVDDDALTMDLTGRLLQSEGYEVTWAPTGRQGIDFCTEPPADFVVIDFRLPDISGIKVLEEIRKRTPATACIISTGFASLEMAVEALRLGAVDFLTKPLFVDDLIAAIQRITVGQPQVPDAARGVEPDVEFHARSRWADLVARARYAPRDPRTLHEWGRSVGASVGCIRNWCHTAGLPARRSLQLARVLRAVVKRQRVQAAPEDLLDIVDSRTLTKLLTASGGAPGMLPSSVEDLLERQRLIEDVQAIAVLQTTLKANPTLLCSRTGISGASGTTRVAKRQ
jgi:ActR/RegA family two-component response regulator